MKQRQTKRTEGMPMMWAIAAWRRILIGEAHEHCGSAPGSTRGTLADDEHVHPCLERVRSS